MDIKTKEVRYLNTNIELRSVENEKESRHIEGYGCVFNQESQDMGFIEIIRSGAITEELIAQSDVCCFFNHDMNKLLGRSVNGEGTLSLSVDEHGLRFSLDLPNTPDGDTVLELVKRGDITACSFAFCVSPEEGAEEWIESNGKYTRYINKIAGLFDVSPVVFPAYQGTEVSARSMESFNAFKEQKEQEKRDAEIAAEEQRVNTLNEKHDALLAEIETW